jgi:ABC-type polysaccharide/polyol phosphate transport system ATPase subunit
MRFPRIRQTSLNPLNSAQMPQRLPMTPAPATDQGNSAVSLQGVTKLFSRTDARADTLKENLLASLARRSSHNLLVALEDVNLEIAPGESLGLIGPNGSGKSTMLKLIAGITTPTRGTVRVQGNVLGLIELGAGFHPDLTGEENIRLQGAIDGRSAKQVEAQIESILEFAELKDFRHMAVKHYSSGMFVRLGFSIAVHAEPDIFLVDEVIAVGDQNFQERCLREIKRQRQRGMTLVFVTHFPEQAERVCDRVAWLDQGRIRKIGPSAGILAEYHQETIDRQHAQSEGRATAHTFSVGLPGRFGSGEARIEAVRLQNAQGLPCTHFRRGETLVIELDYSAMPGLEAVDCVVILDSIDGTILTAWWADYEAGLSHPVKGKGQFHIEVPEPPLLPGRYRLTLAVSPPGHPNDHYDVLYKLFYFTVETELDWDTVAPIELKPELEIKPEGVDGFCS